MNRKVEIRHIDVIRAANLAAALGFIIYGVLAVIMIPIFLLMSFGVAALGAKTGEADQAFPLAMMAGMLVLYPILGAVFGWLMTALATWIYNFLARLMGGIRLQVDADLVPTPAARDTSGPPIP